MLNFDKNEIQIIKYEYFRCVYVNVYNIDIHSSATCSNYFRLAQINYANDQDQIRTIEKICFLLKYKTLHFIIHVQAYIYNFTNDMSMKQRKYFCYTWIEYLHPKESNDLALSLYGCQSNIGLIQISTVRFESKCMGGAKIKPQLKN